jgi:signal transduction histidine kinase
VVDNQGRPGPRDKTLEIEIAKSFWQTNFFRLSLLAGILFAGWLFFKWYSNERDKRQKRALEKVKDIEKERTRIATDMHDDLGAGLSRIKFLSQALINKGTKDAYVRSGLEKITAYSDEMTEKMGEIVWALNEKNDTLADLVAYTRSYAMEYLASHDIECEANTPLHLPGSFIPGEMRRNIFLAVKECLHNIVKHAGATRVLFTAELGEGILINIHDNGKGIDWDHLRPHSNGLRNIRQRMDEIKGKVEFFNKNGTQVRLYVPLDL